MDSKISGFRLGLFTNSKRVYPQISQRDADWKADDAPKFQQDSQDFTGFSGIEILKILSILLSKDGGPDSNRRVSSDPRP
ncbi:MAG: hypothetical protein PHQ12_09730, partial [Chthoniobacteraceae bacterium]|nr:hypothetical protein [Chthoniobacteraceae bacterium]